jgi:predicted alternative tryptophan synthase beta-subunit
MMQSNIIFLSPNEMPCQWYNILADIKLNPPLGPDGKPISPSTSAATIFSTLAPMKNILQMNLKILN